MGPNTEHDRRALLALMLLPGAGRAAIRDARALTRRLGLSLDALLSHANRQTLALEAGASDGLAVLLGRYKPAYADRAQRLLDRAQAAGIIIMTDDDPGYPPKLRRFLERQAPPLLFMWGNRKLLDAPMAGIVGARKVTKGGGILAEECARTLAEYGAVIVSGGAAGVDTAAQVGTLGVEGRMVVILPQGLLTCHIPASFVGAMRKGRTLVMSEFAPDARWTTLGAVTRNATISALARMVCVIEPRKRGGSIRTARFALAQGKRVLVHHAQDVPELLAHAGAMPIIDATGQFNPARLCQLWATTPEPPGGQATLALGDTPTSE